MLSEWPLVSVLTLYGKSMNINGANLRPGVIMVFCNHLGSPALLPVFSSSASALTQH